jgi:hypothetical protein
MAALDQRLARGERMLSAVDQACADMCRLACAFMPRGWGRKEDGAASPPPAGPEPSPASVH